LRGPNTRRGALASLGARVTAGRWLRARDCASSPARGARPRRGAVAHARACLPSPRAPGRASPVPCRYHRAVRARARAKWRTGAGGAGVRESALARTGGGMPWN